mmetsp:Transcript_2735/g.7088  ORF Transcript_2735/g.7088 Transcript_2735/m.7088 type:complete len:114 (+) Transcript_2735:435-776(+)
MLCVVALDAEDAVAHVVVRSGREEQRNQLAPAHITRVLLLSKRQRFRWSERAGVLQSAPFKECEEAVMPCEDVLATAGDFGGDKAGSTSCMGSTRSSELGRGPRNGMAERKAS